MSRSVLLRLLIAGVTWLWMVSAVVYTSRLRAFNRGHSNGSRMSDGVSLPRRSAMARVPSLQAELPPVRLDFRALSASIRVWHALHAHQGRYNLPCGELGTCKAVLNSLFFLNEDPSNRTALAELEGAAVNFHQHVTKNSAQSSPSLRRLIMAVLMMARQHMGAHWREDHQDAHNRIALLLYHAHQTAARAKGIVELMHMSHCGGSGLCRLAQRNGCKTPKAGGGVESVTEGRCLVSDFGDEAMWTVPYTGRYQGRSVRLEPPHTYQCSGVLQQEETTCAQRSRWGQASLWEAGGCTGCTGPGGPAIASRVRPVPAQVPAGPRHHPASSTHPAPKAHSPAPKPPCLHTTQQPAHLTQPWRGCCSATPPSLHPSTHPATPWLLPSRSHMHTAGLNFYTNERQLHGGGSDPAAAQPCAQLFSVIALRHPQQHMTAMLQQIQHDTQVGPHARMHHAITSTWHVAASGGRSLPACSRCRPGSDSCCQHGLSQATLCASSCHLAAAAAAAASRSGMDQGQPE
jgi:hypothetical protein